MIFNYVGSLNYVFLLCENFLNIDGITIFSAQVNDLPQQLEKMNELNHLPGFRHDAKLIEETGSFKLLLV